MPDSLMYQEDVYVVLETDQPEVFLTPEELLLKLQAVLQATPPEDLPQELQRLETLEQQARRLVETGCEWAIAPGHYLQWYATRLEK